MTHPTKLKFVLNTSNELMYYLDDEIQNKIKCCISFDVNEIIIGEEDEKTIHFIEDLILYPDDYKEYEFLYQNTNYSVVAEVLFALIIKQIKKKYEKQFILKPIEFEMEKHNEKVFERITKVFQKLPGEEYDEQRLNYLSIQDMYEKYLRFKRILERNNLSIDPSIPFDYDLQHQFGIQFSMKQKEEMKYCQLDNYTIFIASQYFETINDFLNLIKAVKRFSSTTTKFYYNPISLTKKTKYLFPNIQTFHCYQPQDEYLKSKKIFQYIDWNEMEYQEAMEKKGNNNVQFKKIRYTNKDFENEYFKQKTHYNSKHFPFKLHLPEGVTHFENKIYYQYLFNLKEITIPKSLSNLTQNYFVEYEYLTNINIPLNETRVIYGNKIYNNNECFDQSILLPTSIQIINGMKVEPFTSFVVPSFVTSLEEHCFFRCRKLEELVIPETVKEVTRNVIQHLYLTSLTIPSWMKVYGNKIMNDKKDFKEVMVFDTNTMKQIN